MIKQSSVGVFGKLPAHGDFLSRNLPTQFVNVWDSWLQGYVSSSQEQIGESWLDVYLTSPIWRFVFSAGVVDQNLWQGILLPSVDRVGRYFPLSLVRPLPANVAPAAVITATSGWFDAVEGAALSALEGSRRIDDLLPELDNLQLGSVPVYHKLESSPSTLGCVVRAEDDTAEAASVIPHFLDNLLKDTLRSYSIWSTRGSQLVEPCTFYAPGLPQRRGISAMLDGQWQARGWQEPVAPAGGGR